MLWIFQVIGVRDLVNSTTIVVELKDVVSVVHVDIQLQFWWCKSICDIKDKCQADLTFYTLMISLAPPNIHCGSHYFGR
jgi:hypothetical protein